jgi:hypothetical protein
MAGRWLVIASCWLMVGCAKSPPHQERHARMQHGSSKIEKMDNNQEVTGDSSAALKPFVLVELFTSEGCSSCPPADKVLSRLRKTAQKKQWEVIPLSFQVDYWNYLGWRDPFSQRKFSDRQRMYAHNIVGSGVYTPQMVVNGQYQVVGSDEQGIEQLVEQERKKAPQVSWSVAYRQAKDSPDTLRFSYQLKQPQPGLQWSVMVTEDRLRSNVRKGENAGSLLEHDAVVRTMVGQRLTEKTQGEESVTIPEGVVWKHLRWVSVLQLNNGRVVGAKMGRLDQK